MIKQKGQVFTLDFFIGLFAFIVLLVVGFTLLFSFLPNSNFKDLYGDATYLSTVLIDSGYPPNWNSTTVLLPGIADDHRLNITKLHEFQNISYENSKLLFHITSDYVFFFKNQTDYLNLSKCNYGYLISVNTTSCEPNLLSFNYKNLVKTQRLLAYDGRIIMMVIYTWKR